MRQSKLDEILKVYNNDEILLADGFDEAVVGIEPTTLRIIYSIPKMVGILVEKDGMSDEDAIEYLEYNTFSAYVGEQTPIYIEDDF
jgi:hypothetical protein